MCRCMFILTVNEMTGMSAQAGRSIEVDDVVSSELVELCEARDCSGWPPISCAYGLNGLLQHSQ